MKEKQRKIQFLDPHLFRGMTELSSRVFENQTGLQKVYSVIKTEFLIRSLHRGPMYLLTPFSNPHLSSLQYARKLLAHFYQIAKPQRRDLIELVFPLRGITVIPVIPEISIISQCCYQLVHVDDWLVHYTLLIFFHLRPSFLLENSIVG